VHESETPKRRQKKEGKTESKIAGKERKEVNELQRVQR
jgi:hypothetical protein